MTTRHSTGKRCPRSPRRDVTERNKPKLSPWTLSSAASTQADRPRTAHHKATREAMVKTLSAGQRDESVSCQAAGTIVALAPPQRADTSCPSNKQTKRRAPRSTPPAGVLPRPAYCHIRRAGAQARQAGARHRLITSKGKSPNHPLVESIDSTKASGLLSGTTIRVPLIGVPRSF